MEDSLKTKDQLISELRELRIRVALYEEPESTPQRIPPELIVDSENYFRILDASPN